MPFLEFVGCRERIARAEIHRKAFAEEWNSFVEDEPYGPSLVIAPDGTGSLSIHGRYDHLPSIFALELGEMLYQLRAALDGAIYACAIRDTGMNPPPSARTLEFPVCSTSEQFQSAGVKIAPLAAKRKKIVESVQPYMAPAALKPELSIFNLNRALQILNDWARVDRHRTLHLVGSWVSEANPILEVPHGVEIDFIGVTHDGLLEGDHEVASFNLSGFKPGMNVRANPNSMIDAFVSDDLPRAAANDTLAARITGMMVLVETVVRGLEDSFLKP